MITPVFLVGYVGSNLHRYLAFDKFMLLSEYAHLKVAQIYPSIYIWVHEFEILPSQTNDLENRYSSRRNQAMNRIEHGPVCSVSIKVMWLSEILDHGLGGLVFQWSSAIKSPRVCSHKPVPILIWLYICYIYTHLYTYKLLVLGVVAESVEHGSRVQELIGLNPWSSQTNDV